MMDDKVKVILNKRFHKMPEDVFISHLAAVNKVFGTDFKLEDFGPKEAKEEKK